MARNDPETLFFSSWEQAVEDAAKRCVSVWEAKGPLVGRPRFASGTYDGLRYDMGWDAAGSYGWRGAGIQRYAELWGRSR